MKTLKKLLTIIFLSVLAGSLVSCYTTLGSTKGVSAGDQVYSEERSSYQDYDYAEPDSEYYAEEDSLEDGMGLRADQVIINKYYISPRYGNFYSTWGWDPYWAVDWYDPFYYSTGVYVDIYLGFGVPYWRPFWHRPWFAFSVYDPFWWDFYYGYPIYVYNPYSPYYPYYPAYYYGGGGYVATRPFKKRDWDRRDARPVVRRGNRDAILTNGDRTVDQAARHPVKRRPVVTTADRKTKVTNVAKRTNDRQTPRVVKRRTTQSKDRAKQKTVRKRTVRRKASEVNKSRVTNDNQKKRRSYTQRQIRRTNRNKATQKVTRNNSKNYRPQKVVKKTYRRATTRSRSKNATKVKRSSTYRKGSRSSKATIRSNSRSSSHSRSYRPSSSGRSGSSRGAIRSGSSRSSGSSHSSGGGRVRGRR